MNLITRRAVAMALAGTAMSAGAISSASASTTMYNMNNFGGLNGNTDGWVWSDPANTGIGGGNATTPGTIPLGAAGPNVAANPTFGTPAGGNFVNFNSATRAANFVGTASPSATPFGFNATSSLNWGVQLTGVGDTAQISAADSTKYSSASNYTGPAEVDTGAGAWQDATPVTTNATTGVTTGPTGWKHQTDIGLIQTDEDMIVTLSPSVVSGGAPAFVGNFGITVFSGMDTSTASYSHHGRWNCPTCSAGNFGYTNSNPFSTVGVNYLSHSGTVDSNNPFSFLAQAGQIYTIYLGGAGVGSWSQNVSGYQLNVTTSAVPVPAAVWLFSSALAGMGIIGRRKERIQA